MKVKDFSDTAWQVMQIPDPIRSEELQRAVGASLRGETSDPKLRAMLEIKSERENKLQWHAFIMGLFDSANDTELHDEKEPAFWVLQKTFDRSFFSLVEKKANAQERELLKTANHFSFEFRDFIFPQNGITVELGETPRHPVLFKRSFGIQKTPITQLQWKILVRDMPFWWPPLAENAAPDKPAEIPRDIVGKFIYSLNQHTSDYRYRLPTEAEWEFALRGGTQTTYFWGESEDPWREYAWVPGRAKGGGRSNHPVAQLKPNPFGLFDMTGDVFQWVEDLYYEFPDYPKYSHEVSESRSKREVDPDSQLFVVRGGSCLRSAKRSYATAWPVASTTDWHPDTKSSNERSVGFRLVRESK